MPKHMTLRKHKGNIEREMQITGDPASKTKAYNASRHGSTLTKRKAILTDTCFHNTDTSIIQMFQEGLTDRHAAVHRGKEKEC